MGHDFSLLFRYIYTGHCAPREWRPLDNPYPKEERDESGGSRRNTALCRGPTLFFFCPVSGSKRAHSRQPKANGRLSQSALAELGCKRNIRQMRWRESSVVWPATFSTRPLGDHFSPFHPSFRPPFSAPSSALYPLRSPLSHAPIYPKCITLQPASSGPSDKCKCAGRSQKLPLQPLRLSRGR